MSTNILGNEEENSDSDVDFKINTDYAKRYDVWREKEEYQKLKDKHGPVKNLESGESSDDDTEDEDFTPKQDLEFFKAISYLKEKNPRIYDEKVKFFDEQHSSSGDEQTKTKQKEKPMYLKDYERKMLTNRSEFEDEKFASTSGLSIVDEQEKIKEDLKALVEDSDDEEEEAGGLLKARIKTDEEETKEEEDYIKWLKGEQQELKDKNSEAEMKYLRDDWNKPDLDRGEAFLKDYILNKKYLDKGDDNYIPSYEEIVGDCEELSEDERTIEKQSEFEHKYNFRFEEPDQEFIKRYPRTIEHSMRRKDDRRKKQREERKQRKLEEKRKKKEEIKRLKALKRKEIMERLEKLKEAVGNNELPFDVDDLEGDFDPDKYDSKMAEVFSDQFYNTGEDVGEKPVFSDNDDCENWDRWEAHDPNHSYEAEDTEPHCEDPDFNMDCEADVNVKREIPDTGKKKRRGKTRLHDLLEAEKPRFDPKQWSLDEYINQYYNLGDNTDSARFEYREVIANDFGLSTDEIVLASERELNQWASLKKMFQYRKSNEEQRDVNVYRNKSKNLNYKSKILSSLYRIGEDEEERNELGVKEQVEQQPEKDQGGKKKKRKRKKKKVPAGGDSTPGKSDSVQTVSDNKLNGESVKERRGTSESVKERRGTSESVKPVKNQASKLKNIEEKKKQKSGHGIEQNLTKHTTSTNELKGGKSGAVVSTSKTNELKGGKSGAAVSTSKANELKPDKSGAAVSRKSKTNKKRKRDEEAVSSNKMLKKQNTNALQFDDSRLSSYGFNPKKVKNKIKFGGRK